MERNFNNESFEDFLQEQLQNHRMYPKDSVWRQINQSLHGERRWPALTFAALFLIGLTTLICFHFSSRQNIFSIKPALEPLQIGKSMASTNASDKPNAIGFLDEDHSNVNASKASNTKDTHHHITTTEPVAKAIPGNDLIRQNTPYTDDKEYARIMVSNNVHPWTKVASQNAMPVKTNEVTQSLVKIDKLPEISFAPLKVNIENEQTPKEVANAPVSIVDMPEAQETKTASLIEKFEANRKSSRFSFQLYVAPSVSYRRLSEDEAIKGNNTDDNGPVSVNKVANVNDVVRHKPSKGLEAGIGLSYDFSRKLRLKTGFQFNARQYYIDAYRSNTEASSIALVGNNGVDTINTYAFYRTFNGNSSTELVNRYYQLSVPLGIEWEILGNKKFQLNIAGNIQPTYLVNRNAYIITTNFKNYTENDDLVRRWNLNTNIEAFVSMTVGEFKWQLGPQVRYQPNSTFIGQYPIKEHLIDYGIKLGVSTRLR